MDWQQIIQGSFQQAFGPPAIVYCLAAIGLNVHFGYTGLLNFGQAGFMAVAGYALASFVATWGLSFWLGIAAGLLASVVLALLLGIPTLRLRADYLAIVTIAAAEIIRQTLGSVKPEGVLRRPGRPAVVHRLLPQPQPVPLDGRHRHHLLAGVRLLGDDRSAGAPLSSAA